MVYAACVLILFIIELIYFKLADKFNIIDKPNHRSSHSIITIRGGGIIFPISVLLWFIYSGFQYPLFVSGLLLISTVSFFDDLKDISRRLRLGVHLLALALVFSQLGLWGTNWLVVLTTFIFFVGAINAYNFMDGINGITGLYSLLAVLTLLWVNVYRVHFIDNALVIAVAIGLLIFNYFNSRKKAVCFAGDVGSISIAFIICFLLIKLILQTSDIRYLLMLAVYGIDAVFTIMLRLYRRENIFQAHRSHLYQLLVNERNYKHVTVSLLYFFTQLIVNIGLLATIGYNTYQIIIGFLIMLAIVYVFLRSLINNKLYNTRTM